MVTSVGFSVLKTRGEGWFSHTIPCCFHHPYMITCYPNTDSNMTCHSERAMPLGDCCKLAHLCNFGREHSDAPASTLWAACMQAANPAPPPQPTHSPNPSFPRKHPLSPLYCFLYCLLIGYWFLESLLSQLFYFPIFALQLWHLSFFVPFHKLVQQNRPWLKKKKGWDIS